MATEEEKVLKFLEESLGVHDGDDGGDMELKWNDEEIFGIDQQMAVFGQSDDKKESKGSPKHQESGEHNARENRSEKHADIKRKEEIRRMCHEYLMFLEKNNPSSPENYDEETETENELKKFYKGSKEEFNDNTPNYFSAEESEDTASYREAHPRVPLQGVHPPQLFAEYLKRNGSAATVSSAEASTEEGACCSAQESDYSANKG